MSFYDIGTGATSLQQGIDRRKDDRAALAIKLKAKLRELRAAGLEVEFDEEEVEAAPPALGSLESTTVA